jgi:pimeloyl-ACP methyl ester carboxylesterase
MLNLERGRYSSCMHMRHLTLLLFLFLTGTMTTMAAANPSYDQDLSGYPYPFKVYYYKFQDQKQDLRMAYMRVYPGDSGKSNGKIVVLLHGKNFNGAYWARTAKALADQGYQVIIPDQIGFGKSSKPEHYQFTFQALAHNTKMLLNSLGINDIYLVGHSMGGMLAIRYTLMYSRHVKKLVLIDPIGLEDWSRKVPYHSVDDWFKKELSQTPASLREYERQNYYHGQWKDSYEQWLQPVAGWLNGRDHRLLAWDAALTDDMIFTQPVYYELQDLNPPVLLIAGSEDRTAMGKDFVSQDTRNQLGLYQHLAPRAAYRIPHARLLMINGLGHAPQIENFKSIIRPLKQFLSE